VFHLVSYWLVLGEPKYNINRFVLQGSGDFTWRFYDLWRISGDFTWRGFWLVV